MKSGTVHYSLYAVYDCTSETQVNGFWEFHFRGFEGPNGELLMAVKDLERDGSKELADQ